MLPRYAHGALLGLLAGAGALCGSPDARAQERYRDEVFGAVAVARDIAYGRARDFSGREEILRLDLYRPVGDRNRRRRVVIWVHGGGFTGGDKGNPTLSEYARRFARRGYVTASINYRLRRGRPQFRPRDVGSPVFRETVLAAQHDAQAAVRWFRANADRYAVDGRRIAIAGVSAGAITALNVAYHSDDPGSSGNPGYSSRVFAAVSVAGASDPGLVDGGDPPALLFHGTADRTVPVAFARATCAAARARAVVCLLREFAGARHGIFATRREEIIPEAARFLLEPRRTTRLRLSKAKLSCRTGRLVIAGTITRGAPGSLKLAYRARVSGRLRTLLRSTTPRRGRFRITVRVSRPWSTAARGAVRAAYRGSANHRPARAGRRVRGCPKA